MSQYQSLIAFNKKIELIINNDSVCNYTMYEINQNVLLSKKNKIINGNANSFKMNIYLNNFNNVYPNEIVIKELHLWDNTEDKNNQENSEQLHFEFENSDNKFKPVIISSEKEVIIPILCCLTKDEHIELKKYNSSGKFFNINIDMTVKNVCNIYTNCKLYGTLKESNIKDVGTINVGGSKTQRTYFVRNGYLKILKVYEEDEVNA